MHFLENLILGKRGTVGQQSYAEDGNTEGLDGVSKPSRGPLFPSVAGLQRGPKKPRTANQPAQAGSTADEKGTGEIRGETRHCGNLACGRGWTLTWKRRENPIFDGQWACSRSCLAAMVKASLKQAAGQGEYDEGPEPYHHRIPLGLVMLAQGWITHPQLQRALEAQRLHGSGRIGEWLVSECGMQPERIARGLSVQWNCPVLSTESFWPEAMAVTLPRVFLEEYGALPLRLAGRKILYVGFKDCLDASASFALEQMTGLRVESGVLSEVEFGRAREVLLRCEFPQETIAAVSDGDGLVRAIAQTVEHEQPEASRLVRLHRHYWLRVWAKGDAERTAGDLPTTANGVRDYLFTIGSRREQVVQDAEGLGVAPFEGRAELSDDGDEVFAVRGFKDAQGDPGEQPAFEAQPEESGQEVAPTFENDSSLAEAWAEESSARASVFSGALQFTDSSADRPFMIHKREVTSEEESSPSQAAEGPKAVPSAERHFLARQDFPWFARATINEPVEAIEGEYLPVEPVGIEPTDVPGGLLQGWNRLDLLKRLKMSSSNQNQQ